jgi:hypothetical protein
MNLDRNDLYMLGLDIQVGITELHELTRTLKELDEEYMNNPTEDTKLFLDETIDRYKKVVDKTKIQLEAYFAEEAKIGEPTDFLFRRLYAKLKEAY